MIAQQFISKAIKEAKANSSELLTAFGVTGVVTTAFLAAKAALKADRKLKDEFPGQINPRHDVPRMEQIKATWTCYIPPVVSGAVTIGCVIGASKTSAKRTAAAVTAYSITERAFSEYKEKIVEQIGAGKEQKARDELAQKKVNENPVGKKEVLICGTGQVLCCELYTGRYFKFDMEGLRKARNDINGEIVYGIYMTLNDFYDHVGLPHTTTSGHLGWDNDRLMELEFSTVLSEANEPCLAFNYNYVKPVGDRGE